jgi:hypothetical protein
MWTPQASSAEYPGPLLSELRERVASLASRYRYDLRSAVLGRRRLLWPRAQGVQWNPADDLCLALELRIERGERRELSGRLVEIKPRRAFAR